LLASGASLYAVRVAEVPVNIVSLCTTGSTGVNLLVKLYSTVSLYDIGSLFKFDHAIMVTSKSCIGAEKSCEVANVYVNVPMVLLYQ
jgi:hypothetical protein